MENKNYSLSDDSCINGLDLDAGQTWIYPTNYPTREYQYNIIEKSLCENTLVSLPTGLGKTFIAAVIMYNFYRWYPTSKIIFMAPTRPLVKQQIDACYNVMAIPKIVTAELTGSKVQSARNNIWTEKRVFFITPQILQNDLDTVSNLGIQIKCLVIDEAHKAKGNHAYCEVVKKLYSVNKYFRILALSATPGKDNCELVEIIKNLLIARVEFRTEESPDVIPYVFDRKLITIVIPLDKKLLQVKNDFMEILEYYTRPLVRHNLINGNCSNLTKGRIFMLMKDYQEKNKINRTSSFAEIIRNFNICLTLYHGYDLLQKHGLRSFQKYFQEHSSNTLLQNNEKLEAFLKDIQEYLGPSLNVTLLPDGNIIEIPKSVKYGHPKFYKLQEILIDHFKNSNQDSRVIVFCEYCEGVREVYAMLLQHKPLIRPMCFMGQNSITQRQQINIIKSFKNGECNCLISTCIGEEGIDIGEIDLIICFDVSNKSPIRMIQRMGRTGRKKDGKIIILVTQGKEEQNLKDCLVHKNHVAKQLMKSDIFYKPALYKDNARMLPNNIIPKCEKRFVTVNKEPIKNSSIKDMFNTISSKRKETLSQQLVDVEIIDFEDVIPEEIMLWNRLNPKIGQCDEFVKKNNLSKKLNYFNSNNRSRSYLSVNSQILQSLLQNIEMRTYNLPISQIAKVKVDQLNENQNGTNSSNNFKQSDIRNMFVKPKSVDNFAISQDDKFIRKSTKSIFDQTDLIELNEEISNYLAINKYKDNMCKSCNKNSYCTNWIKIDNVCKQISWSHPNESITDQIDNDILNEYISINQFISQERAFEEMIVEEKEYSKPVFDLCVKEQNNLQNNDLDSILSIFLLTQLEDIYIPYETMIMHKNDYNFTLKAACNNTNSTNDFVMSSTKKPIFKKNDDTSLVSTEICDNLDLKMKKTPNNCLQELNISSFSNSIVENSIEDSFEKNYITTQNIESASKSDLISPTIGKSATPVRKTLKPSKRSLFSKTNYTPSRPNLSNISKNIDLVKKPKPTLTSSLFSSVKNENRFLNDNVNKETSFQQSFTLDAICDMSIFGFDENVINAIKNQKEIDKTINTIKLDDKEKLAIDQVSDLSMFGLELENNKKAVNLNTTIDYKTVNNNENIKNIISKYNGSSEDDFDLQNSPLLNKSQKLLKRKNILRTKNTFVGKNDSSTGEYSNNVCNKTLSKNIKSKITLVTTCNSSDEFENSEISPVKNNLQRSERKKKRKNCSFLDNEAEVSVISLLSSDENLTEDDDKLEESFVDDNLKDEMNITNVHAMYLQSVRSPTIRGKFKIPTLKAINNKSEIYSQLESNLNDTYANDSFCISDDEDQLSHKSLELSDLEIAEQILEIDRKCKRKNLQTSNVERKRKRIIEISDDSD